MKKVCQPYLDKSKLAEDWLKNATECDGGYLLEQYPDGAIFKSKSAHSAVRFLEKCAEREISNFRDDHEMDGIRLLIDFEFQTMAKDQIELAIMYSPIGESESISFTLSCIKKIDGEFEVFGDDEFALIQL